MGSNHFRKYFYVLISLIASSCGSGGSGIPINTTPTVDLAAEAFYSFDETSGTSATNSVQNIFNGQITGASRTSGKVNNALYFGLNLPSYVQFSLFEPDKEIIVDFPDNEISIEAWVNFESLNPAETYHFFGDQLYGIKSFRMDVIDGQFRFILYTNSTGSSSIELARTNFVFGVDTWYHLAFTYDGSSAKFYVDGALNSTSNITSSVNRVYNNLFLGGLESGSNSFPGYIDELRFSSRLRTAQEISQYYNATL